LFASCLLAAVPATALAQDRILVVDLTKAGSEDAHGPTYTFMGEPGLLAALDKANPANAATERTLAISAAPREAHTTRWLLGTGGILHVFVFHDEGTTAQIQFKETARSTRLALDFAALAKLGLNIALAPEAEPAVRLTKATYTLTRPRANLVVTTTLQRGAATKTDSVQVTVVTGGAEHLFLAANAGSTDLDQLKFDETSHTLQPRKTPTAFSVGFNYSFGDILTDPADLRGGRLTKLWNGLSMGATLQASRRPFDQIGASAGLRYNPIPVLDKLVSFETVSPFVGIVWNKNDRVDAAGNRLEGRRYGRGTFVWGVSLNLDKAMGWVGGGGK
jgi:hypothetical protein